MLHAESHQPPIEATRGSLRKSLLLHVAVLGVVVGLPYLHQPPKVTEQSAIQAVLVEQVATPPAPVAPPPPEPVPAEPLPEPEKLVVPEPVREPPKIALPKAPVKLPESKPEPAKPIIRKPTLNTAAFDAEMNAMKRDMQQAEMKRQMDMEMAKSAAAMQVSANAAIVDRYRGMISQKVENKWNRPVSTRSGMVVTLRISILPGGDVGNVVTVTPSGDPAFDESARQAVLNASPLPVPDDLAVFNQNFRNFILKFNPKDL